ncbi:MAG: LysR family transcriptional regulator, partial [Gammaproteobacteria bacterium]
MPDPQDLNDLAYFAWVVEAQGFAPAGRAHGVPKSRLSRRIKALEERLGVRLLQRSTRRFSVTATGEEFYRHCKAVLLEAEAARESVERRRSEPRGVVRLTCPIGLLHDAVGDMLAGFLLACPQVELHVAATNRRPDVIGEGLD